MQRAATDACRRHQVAEAGRVIAACLKRDLGDIEDFSAHALGVVDTVSWPWA